MTDVDWNFQLAEQLDWHWREQLRWIGGVRGLGPDEMARAVGPAEGPWADHSMAELVLHINREMLHHGAEIALLRDLYRWHFDGKGA